MKKKIVALLLAITVLPCNVFAAEAETEMSYDELLAKYEELQEKYDELEAKLEELIGDQEIEEQSPAEAYQGDVLEYGSGMYKVGVDMEPGVYFLTTDTDYKYGAYVTVSRDANQDDLIYIESFDQNLIAEFRDGEYVTIDHATASTYTRTEPVNLEMDNFEVEIGVHLPAGEYKLEATDSLFGGYYTIYSDNRFDDIVAINDFENIGYVSVSDGQFLIVQNGRIIQ